MKNAKLDHSELFLLTKVKTIDFVKKPSFFAPLSHKERYFLIEDMYKNFCELQEDQMDFISHSMLDNNGIVITITQN